jgi:hypothetical protein
LRHSRLLPGTFLLLLYWTNWIFWRETKNKKKKFQFVGCQKKFVDAAIIYEKILHTRKKRGDGWMDVKGGRNSLFILFNFDLKHFDVIMKIVFPNH